MAKFDIDGFLNELGLGGPDAPGAGAPSAPAEPGKAQPADGTPRRRGRPILPAAENEPTPDSIVAPVASVELTPAPSRLPGMPPPPALVPEGTAAPGTGIAGELYKPTDEDSQGRPGELREVLVSAGLATPKQLSAAETIIRQSPGTRLIDVLLDQGVDEGKLFEAVARSMGLRVQTVQAPAEGQPMPFDERLLARLTPEFCKQNQVIPLSSEGDRVVVGTSRPDDVFLIDEVKLRLGARGIKVVVIAPTQMRAAMELLDEAVEDDADVEQILSDIEEDDVRVEAASSEEVDLERQAAESPVIRYVNYIIQTASKEGASDIHIEPGDKNLKVRFRIDGELFEMMQPPPKMASAITSRLKIMANLDIAERRLPQDGRIRCSVQNRKLDLRMSTLPATYGEKVVLRILDTKSINVNLDDLGFDENTLTIWKNQIEQPHGIVLVTGPTGSGKTTTLYSSLRQMDKKSQNVSTVEDPVEYHLDGITQTQTHEKIGMTFAKALKALLRQDPDVIMVGEIRDQETAHTAVQAALTGHLVLSTLHTNDAPSSITRLVNIGIEPFLLGAAVNACLAQRLVRRVCQNCKRAAQLTDEMKEYLSMQGVPTENLFEGAGCDKCRNTGHSGRLGIYELLVIDDQMRDIIARNPNVAEFRRMCCERGMVTLRQDGFNKAARGLTTVQEIVRATEAAM